MASAPYLPTTRVLNDHGFVIEDVSEAAGLSYQHVRRCLGGRHVADRGPLPESIRRALRDVGGRRLERGVIEARAMQMAERVNDTSV